MSNLTKEEFFDLPEIDNFNKNFREKKFDKEMALGLINEAQCHWCNGCDNYKTNDCGCYFPIFKKEMIRKIDEHFDNPPLKLEELKPDMWVWDNNLKMYYKVFAIHEYQRIIEFTHDDDIIDNICKFEENRFYAKEVKDDE